MPAGAGKADDLAMGTGDSRDAPVTETAASMPTGAAAVPADHEVRLEPMERVGFGLGEVGITLIWTLTTAYLLPYYTDIALLPVAALGTLILATRVLDAVFDPLAGLLVDRTRTRWGKARPYLLFGALPYGLLLVATFSVPDLPATQQLLYAFVTFTALGLGYSLLHVPYGSLMPMMTRHAGDKVLLGSLRATGTSVASLVAYISMPVLIAWIGAGDRRRGLTGAVAVIAAAGILCTWVTVATCRERFSDLSRAPRPMRVSLRQMMTNPKWRVSAILGLLMFARIGVMMGSLPYFAKEVMRAPWVFTVTLPLLSVSIFAGGMLTPLLLKRLPLVGCNIGFTLLSIVLALAQPFVIDHPFALIALLLLSNTGSGMIAATVYIMASDALELQQRLHGVRDEGLFISSVSFGLKVGIALGSALVAFALGWAKYDPLHLTSSTALAMQWIFYGVPVAIMALQVVALSRYPRAYTPSERILPASSKR
jgi:GPH family glycoside/pentoside/hexuronide:cation symporter